MRDSSSAAFNILRTKTCFQTVQDITSCLRYTEKGVFSFFKKKKTTHTFLGIEILIGFALNQCSARRRGSHKRAKAQKSSASCAAELSHSRRDCHRHNINTHAAAAQTHRSVVKAKNRSQRARHALHCVCVCVRVRKRAGGWAGGGGGRGRVVSGHLVKGQFGVQPEPCLGVWE